MKTCVRSAVRSRRNRALCTLEPKEPRRRVQLCCLCKVVAGALRKCPTLLEETRRASLSPYNHTASLSRSRTVLETNTISSWRGITAVLLQDSFLAAAHPSNSHRTLFSLVVSFFGLISEFGRIYNVWDLYCELVFPSLTAIHLSVPTAPCCD